MTQFTVRHDVFESNSSDGTRVVATKAVVQSSNLTSGTQFRAQRTLQELFMTITFHSEGGTSEYDSIKALVGDKIAELPDASKGTYLFDGWYTSAIGGTKVTTDTIVSSTIEHLYAHWIAATTLTFNSNGGTISGSTTINAYVGYPLNIKGSTFPTATGPSDTPNFIGFYTSASGGSKITPETVYDGSYTTLYAHYINANWTSKFTCTPSSTYPKVGIYSATRYSSSNPIYIDWGDGETQEVNDNISQIVHEYKTFGTYQVKISDNISSFALSYNNSTWYQTTTNNYYNVISLDTFSSKITSMPTYCFYQLNALRSAIWPSNCTSIPNYAFYYCQSSYFKQFVVPQGVTSIGSYAFAYCRYLSDITLPTSLRTLNSYCFEYCWYDGNQKTSIVIPEGVTSIPSYCFYYCYYLNDITLPSTVTSIGTYAFSYCWYYSGSVGITIPNGVTSLPNRCFYYCRYLPSITMPDTLTSIGAYCFYYCYYNLKSISIPKKCSSIGDYCFYYCYYLKDITIPRTTAPTLGGTNVFGTSTSYYTGRATYSTGTNTLHVLKNASGYDAGIWTQYLLNSSCCGYHISEEDMGYEKKAVEFNANGGTGGGTRDVYVGFEFGKIGIQAVGPAENPTLMGWFTQPEGGDQITSDTVYDGTYTILYAHYGNASYSVDLNGQWFKDDGTGIDPKGNSYALQYTTNPDTSLYDGTYVSYSNWHVNNGYSVMRINLVGYDEFTIYLRSYAESNYDYAIAGNIDQAITSGSPSTYKARTYGNQQSGTAIGSYTKVTYTGLGGGNHFIDVCYRKDSSVDSNQDRGYVLIDNPIPPHLVTITFETNGGSEIAQIQMMSGNKITKPTDPTKTDWYFSGWYSDSGLTQAWDFNTIVYDDVTLYAMWRDTELPYDAEVEYLESNGTQWINTQIVPNVNSKIDAEIAWQSTQSTTWAVFFGVTGNDSSSDGILARQYNSTRNNFNPWFCNSEYAELQITNVALNTKHSISLKKNTCTFDGTQRSLTTTGTPYAGSIYLFCGNNGGSAWRHSYMKMYSFKIYDVDGTTLLRDMIPVRNDGVGYMYDRVSGQLFGNSGTGNFILGSDIEPPTPPSKTSFSIKSVDIGNTATGWNMTYKTSDGVSHQVEKIESNINYTDDAIMLSASYNGYIEPSDDFLQINGIKYTSPITLDPIEHDIEIQHAKSSCLLKGTKILLADGSTKNVEDLTYDDELLVWNFDEGKLDKAKPIWLKKEEKENYWFKNTYKSGKTLNTTGESNTGWGHRTFDLNKNKFIYTTESVSDKIYTLDGIDEHISCEKQFSECEYYNLYTAKHFNCFANGILASGSLNNLYPIKDMKYVKYEARKCHSYDEFSDILTREQYDGLRLEENKTETSELRTYCHNMYRKDKAI